MESEAGIFDSGDGLPPCIKEAEPRELPEFKRGLDVTWGTARYLALGGALAWLVLAIIVSYFPNPVLAESFFLARLLSLYGGVGLLLLGAGYIWDPSFAAGVLAVEVVAVGLEALYFAGHWATSWTLMPRWAALALLIVQIVVAVLAFFLARLLAFRQLLVGQSKSTVAGFQHAVCFRMAKLQTRAAGASSALLVLGVVGLIASNLSASALAFFLVSRLSAFAVALTPVGFALSFQQGRIFSVAAIFGAASLVGVVISLAVAIIAFVAPFFSGTTSIGATFISAVRFLLTDVVGVLPSSLPPAPAPVVILQSVFVGVFYFAFFLAFAWAAIQSVALALIPASYKAKQSAKRIKARLKRLKKERQSDADEINKEEDEEEEEEGLKTGLRRRRRMMMT